MQPDNETAPSTGTTQLLALLVRIWRLRKWVIIATALGVAVGFFRSMVTPSEYRSGGKLFIRPGLREVVVPEAAFSGAMGGSARVSGGREAVTNQMHVLSSPELFDMVVQTVGVDTVLAKYDPNANKPEQMAWYSALMHRFRTWWFAAGGDEEPGESGLDRARIASLLLQRRVIFVPEIGANVISVYYFASSPDRARQVVNAVLDAARRMHQKVFETMSGVEKVESEHEAHETLARAAEAALRDFRAKHHIHDYQAQQDGLLAYVRELDEQIDAIDVDLARGKAECVALTADLAKIPPQRTAPGSETSIANPQYTAISTLLASLRQQALDLEGLRGGDLSESAYLQRKTTLTRQIEVVTAYLGLEKMQIRLEGHLEPNPEHQAVARRLADLEISLQGQQSKRAQLETLRKAQRQELQDLDLLAPEFRTFDLDAKQKRATADRLAEGLANLRAVQRLEQLNLSSIQVMQPGTLELARMTPSRLQIIALFTFGAAVLGFMAVAAWALFDGRIRIRADLLRLGLGRETVLASQPDASEVFDPLLPSSLADARTDIAKTWTMLAWDRRSRQGLKVACLPCGGADPGRAAAALAIGLSVHGGERVALVSCTTGPGWLATRLGLASERGWCEALRSGGTIAPSPVATTVPGLDFFPMTAEDGAPPTVPHAMAGPGFAALLDRLGADYRFVIVELPTLDQQPEGRSVLGVVDGVQLVVRTAVSHRSEVGDAMTAVKASGARLVGAVLQPVPDAAVPDAATGVPA